MDDTSSSPRATRAAFPWQAAGILSLTLLTFGLRLHRIDYQPLWGDEGWSFYFASMNLGEMIHFTAEDIHPPVYYALLGGWLRVAGSTPEAARFFSILCGTLLVPLAYRVAGHVYDRRAGLTVAAVIALAPLAIYYSQEVRMYSLVTLLGLASVYFFSRLMVDEGPLRGTKDPEGGRRTRDEGRRAAGDGTPTRNFVGYALVTTAALYTMYYAVFVPVFQFILFLITERPRNLADLTSHPFIRSLSTAFLLYLPWIAYAGTKLTAYVQGKRTAEEYLPLSLPHFIGSHLVAFSLGHLSDTTQVLAWLTVLFAPLALLGVGHYVVRASRPYCVLRTPFHVSRFTFSASRLTPHTSGLLALYLLIPLLLGYLVNLVYPFTPRYFERTLMLAAPAWWLLVGAGLAWLWRRSRWALVGVSSILLMIEGVMLLDFYNVPRYRGEDYRPLMAYVHAHSSPDDVFLASYQWQVGFYHAYLPRPRPALYVVPGWGERWAADPAQMRADLDNLVSHHARVWFLAYQALGRLWETEVEAYLNRTAYPVQVDWSLPATKLLLYAGGPPSASATGPFNFADRLLLERAEVGNAPVEAGRGVVPIGLAWQKTASLWSDHRVALRLSDAQGHTWASRDSLPQGGDVSFTDLAPGEQLADRHALAIPAGTPPGDYRLQLSIYDRSSERPLDLLDAQGQPQGVEADLATVQVIQPGTPLPPEALPVQYRTSADFDRRVRLVGYSLGDGPFEAGDTLSFSLFWQALADIDEPYVVFAQLQDSDGKPVALSETPPVYPSDRWSSGSLLRDPHEIPLPAALPPGTYQLAVGLLRRDGSRLATPGDDQAVLTHVKTTQRPHNFSQPSPPQRTDVRFGEGARLVGYDLVSARAVRAGQTLTLVLTWEALATFDRQYTVFVHIVNAQGRIVGQRDQVPGAGAFPTTSWLPGEYLADTYGIPINPDTPPGEYWIEVGLYNPLDGTRLRAVRADGQSPGDRLLITETPIRVEP